MSQPAKFVQQVSGSQEKTLVEQIKKFKNQNLAVAVQQNWIFLF